MPVRENGKFVLATYVHDALSRRTSLVHGNGTTQWETGSDTINFRFPETKGKRIIIRLDAYNLSQDEVGQFFKRFAEGVARIPDYQKALADNPFVLELSFELYLETVN